MSRRVVITGMGTLNPLANTADETWTMLLSGQSGIRSIPYLCEENDASGVKQFRCTVGGVVTVEDYSKYNIDGKLANKMEDFQKFTFCAMQEAALNARLPMYDVDNHEQLYPQFEGMEPAVEDSFRMGVMLGVGVGGIKVMEEQVTVLNDKGPRRVSPFLIPKLISNLSGGWIGQSLHANGISSCYVSACASSTNALGESFLAIANNRADIIVSGGLEATCCRVGFAGFGNMHALTTWTGEPDKASRPFDSSRSGFVMSEGGAILVLEELEHAKRRGVPIIAEIVGYGLTNDAFHITNPSPTGDAVLRAMTDAVRSAGIEPDDLDYINAHGTSTPAGDAMEALTIKRLFDNDKSRYERVNISSTKSMVGHLLGGAGAFEAMVCAKSCLTDMIPPTINLENPASEAEGLDLTANVAKRKTVNYAMSNSFGFGGHNAVIVIKKYQND